MASTRASRRGIASRTTKIVAKKNSMMVSPRLSLQSNSLCSVSLSLTFIVTVSSLLAHLSILAMLLRLMPIERLRSQR